MALQCGNTENNTHELLLKVWGVNDLILIVLNHKKLLHVKMTPKALEGDYIVAFV